MSGALHDIVIRTLEEELADFDIVTDRTADTKREVTDTIMSAFRRIDPASLAIDDPKAVDAFVKLGTAAVKAVDSQEVTTTRKVNAKVKLSEVRRSDNVSEVVTDLLVQMKSGTYTPSDLSLPSIEVETDKLDAKYIADQLPDIAETELRADPDDLS